MRRNAAAFYDRLAGLDQVEGVELLQALRAGGGIQIAGAGIV
jgi:hypothetical protein